MISSSESPRFEETEDATDPKLLLWEIEELLWEELVTKVDLALGDFAFDWDAADVANRDDRFDAELRFRAADEGEGIVVGTKIGCGSSR